MVAAIGRAASGGGSSRIKNRAHPVARDVQLRRKSAKSRSASTYSSRTCTYPPYILPAPPLVSPCLPRPSCLSSFARPRFRSFFVILRPRSVHALAVSPLALANVFFYLFFFCLFFSFSSPCASSPSLFEAEISSIVRQVSFLRLLERNLENVSGTLSGRRWWHRSSIGLNMT